MACGPRSTTLFVLLCLNKSLAFVVPPRPASRSLSPPPLTQAPSLDTWPTALRLDPRWQQEIDENSRRRAQSGVGETAAGAILGGLLAGPFGALFGASIGSNIGAKNAADRARKEELARLGITQDMLDSAQEIGLVLQRTNEGLKAIQDSLETQQRFARRLDRDAAELYERAKTLLQSGDEAKARDLLLQRTRVQDKLKQVLKACADERKRLTQMESNIDALERRAAEMDDLLRRSVSAKTMQETSELGLSLDVEDPLLRKFRDLGID